MSIFRRPQRLESGVVYPTVVDRGSKLEKNEGGFVAGLESNAREILLFLASLIFLLFHLLEGQTGREPRYLGKQQR
jgi:hypothetical protein